jgi:hypothetical protein
MLPAEYPRSTRGVPAEYPRSTRGVLAEYPRSTRAVPAEYPCSTPAEYSGRTPCGTLAQVPGGLDQDAREAKQTKRKQTKSMLASDCTHARMHAHTHTLAQALSCRRIRRELLPARARTHTHKHTHTRTHTRARRRVRRGHRTRLSPWSTRSRQRTSQRSRRRTARSIRAAVWPHACTVCAWACVPFYAYTLLHRCWHL